MMTKDIMRSSSLAIAVRFATWILPPHRKEWAEAMLHEIAYVPSRRASMHWVLGCIFFSIRARASYELVGAFAPRRMLNALLTMGAASVIFAASVYIVQKPYQRERILMFVLHGTRAPAARHMEPFNN
jgi:hypothetical protein